MKIMPCPLNGPRNIQEFICAGPVEPHPNPNRCSDEEWTEYVWMEENLAGVVREWWCHVATSYWFIAERNTVSDEILATYPANRVFSERVEFEPLAPPPEPAAAAKPETQPAPAEATPEPPQETVPPPPPAETPAPPAEAAPDSSEEAVPAEAAPEESATAEEAPAPAEDAPVDDTSADGAPPREPKDPVT